MFIINRNGIKFYVRLVLKGDRYGLDDCKVHDEDEPMVEFYAWKWRHLHGPRGYFVSRYNANTLVEHGSYGLCLDGANREYDLDTVAFTNVITMLALMKD
jgi:hypothetical protein